jgi:zinc transport system ATP-binding protein
MNRASSSPLNGQLAGAGCAARSSVVHCRNLVVGHRGKPILPPIDLSIGNGELWAVIGRNGSGKTTWLRTLLGLLPPVGGEVKFERAEPRLTYLAQRQAFDDYYPLRVREIVAMGTDRGRACFFRRPRANGEIVARSLQRVGASDLAGRSFRELSEGQKQRVLFARVAAAEPDLAVLDEPTSAMDLVAEREAWQLLERLRQETQLALIVVSHYVGLAGAHADRLLLLDRDCQAVVLGTPGEVFGHAVFHERYGESGHMSRAAAQSGSRA